MKKLMLILCFALATQSVFAQQLLKRELDLERFMEELFQFQEEDFDYDDVYETLLQYFLNPLNLNKASAEELRSLFVLSTNELNNLLQYRELFGPFLSIYELQAIPGFSTETIERLLPFISLSEGEGLDGTLLQRMLNADNRYIINRYDRTLETRRGYTPPDTLSGGRLSSRYRGSPDKIYTRFRANRPRDFSIGFTAEKDPGERFAWEPETRTYGFDFWSYHLFLENKGKWKSIALGDYQIQFGQGLLLGAGFFVGKGAETITTIRRSHTGLRPYTSVLETGFFRGAAATYESGNWQLTGFYSGTRRDASLNRDTSIEDAEVFVSSLRTSGLHRTQSEIDGKGIIGEKIMGANATYSFLSGRGLAGATAMFSQYSLPLKRSNQLYNKYEFSGSENLNLGAYYSYTFENINFFGEVATSSSGGLGIVNGVLAGLSPKVEAAFLHRRYDRNFHSFYGAGFSENSRNINEEGFYAGLKINPNRKSSVALYFDRFQFPWLRFRVDAPSDGHEYLLRFNYHPNRNVLLFFQLREEVKDRNFASDLSPLNQVANGIKRNYIINAEFGRQDNLLLRSRVQWSTYQLGSSLSSGMAIVQDLNYNFGKWRLSSRLALFDTQDFDNRQYVFERDVLYTFSIPAYFGQGVRTYLMLQWKFNSKNNFWLRWARSRYFDREVIGSGLDRIDGNQRNDIRFQWIRSF